MISAGIAVEGGGHGLGPGPGSGPGGPYIPTVAAYHPPALPPASEWRKHQEFLRPAPKHTPTTRYNGSTAPLNGTRLLKYPPSITLSHTPHTPSSLTTHSTNHPSIPAHPVNLSQSSLSLKDEPHTLSHPHAPTTEELTTYYSRLYPPPPAFTGIYPGPYAGLYSGPYTPLVRAATAAAAAAAAGYVAAPPPLSPLEQYSPPASATSPHAPSAAAGAALGQGTFVTPAVTGFNTSTGRKESGRDRDRERERDRGERIVQGFKVPSGKEGSLKHRILTRPSDLPPLPSTPHNTYRKLPLPLPLPPKHSPLSTNNNNNNNNTVLPGNFSKGSLIQLASGELRRVEDMRTEDFVLSAARSPELRLAESTVLRVTESPERRTAAITLTYNQNTTQVEFEATVEHPFFVYGQGWASCNPERTLQYYGLKVHHLQVGDILVSLTPREPNCTRTSPGLTTSGGVTFDLSRRDASTVTTTATTTAMTVQVSRPSVSTAPGCMSTMPPPASTCSTGSSANSCPSTCANSAESNSSRKRRWSAPDQICDEHDQLVRRVKE